MRNQAYITNWSQHNAKSLCSFGHTGDGGYSQHGDTFTPGHAKCLFKGCECQQVTWVGFTGQAKRVLGLV